MAQSHRLQEIGEQQAKLQKMQQEQLAKKEVLFINSPVFIELPANLRGD